MDVADGIATFPNGLKLRVNPAAISHQAIADAVRKYPEPAVPLVTVTINGQQVQEENADDPQYQASLAASKDRRAWAVVRAFVVMGTKFEAAPEGTPGVDEVDWDALSYVRDVPSPTNAYERYEMWTRYYGFAHGYADIAVGMGEYLELLRWLAVKSGMTLEAPTAIVATFRDNEERAADSAGATVASAGDGDGGRDAAATGLGY